MLTLFFHDGPVHNYDDARRSDTRLFARFFWEMLARGVYLPCSQFEAAFVSAAHTEDDIDQTIAAASRCAAGLRNVTTAELRGARQLEPCDLLRVGDIKSTVRVRSFEAGLVAQSEGHHSEREAEMLSVGRGGRSGAASGAA